MFMPNPCRQRNAANGGLSASIQEVHGISPPERTQFVELTATWGFDSVFAIAGTELW